MMLGIMEMKILVIVVYLRKIKKQINNLSLNEYSWVIGTRMYHADL